MRIKLFEEFSSSYKSSIVKEIIDNLSDDIDNLLKEYEKYYEKNFERPMSDYDRMLSRLTIVSDMVKSIENYTQDGDVLKSIKSSVSPKGNLEIDAVINRDGKDHYLNTEVIYAGGYNIQRLHYRYITKTSLPRTGKSDLSKEYQEKIKNLTREQKIRQEIDGYEKRIEDNDKRVKEAELLTNEEILDLVSKEPDDFQWPTWEEIVARGADKNYDYSEEKFNSEKEKDMARKIDFWKMQNIIWPSKNSIALKKEIEKLKKKLPSGE
jgi:hypothetical protein